MNETPRPNELSPVVFMGSGGPDLTAPEQVDKSVGMAMQHGLHNTAATLRALSAQLVEAERRNLNLRQIERNVQAERERQFKRAEAAEAELARVKEQRDQIVGDKINSVSELRQVKAELAAYREMASAIDAQGGPNVIRLQMQARKDRIQAEKVEAKRGALDAAWSDCVALLEKTISKTEAERDAALGVLRDLGFDNAFSVYQAARQKGGEG